MMSNARLTLGANKHRHQGAGPLRPHSDFADFEQQTGQIDAQDGRCAAESVSKSQGYMPAAASLQGVAMYQPGPAMYPTGSLLYPVWVPSYVVPPPYAYPLHSYWKPQYQSREQRRTVESTEPTAMSGTGVFLPCAPLSAPSIASERSMTESDGESIDSSSDCSTIEEPAPIKHGQLQSTTPIELLLPEEWEY